MYSTLKKENFRQLGFKQITQKKGKQFGYLYKLRAVGRNQRNK